jgi:hypothetical protein
MPSPRECHLPDREVVPEEASEDPQHVRGDALVEDEWTGVDLAVEAVVADGDDPEIGE